MVLADFNFGCGLQSDSDLALHILSYFSYKYRYGSVFSYVLKASIEAEQTVTCSKMLKWFYSAMLMVALFHPCFSCLASI